MIIEIGNNSLQTDCPTSPQMTSAVSTPQCPSTCRTTNNRPGSTRVTQVPAKRGNLLNVFFWHILLHFAAFHGSVALVVCSNRATLPWYEAKWGEMKENVQNKILKRIASFRMSLCRPSGVRAHVACPGEELLMFHLMKVCWEISPIWKASVYFLLVNM